MATTSKSINGFILLFLVFLAPLNSCFSQNSHDVHFEFDSSDISPAEKSSLNKIYLEKLQNAQKITLKGHTDHDGTLDYNDLLSEKRVQSVLTILKSFGGKIESFKHSSHGENAPLNNNSSDLEKKLNRRVTISWTEDIVKSTEEFGNIQDLYKIIEQEKQAFCIDSKRDTTIFLAQGTIISIPANAFQTSSTQCIEFKTKEVYKYSDMIMENLSTQSDGRLLETGGMVYTEAFDQSGNSISLNPDKKLTIFLPTDSIREDMSLFYGERSAHDQNMNWIQDTSNDNSMPGVDFDVCTDPSQNNEVQCKLFFCRLFGRTDDAFRGMFNKEIRKENIAFRKQLKTNRQDTSTLKNECALLLEQYGLTDYSALRDTLRKIREQKIKRETEEREDRMDRGEGTMNDLFYYVAMPSKLGWINCDAFSSFPNGAKINMTTMFPKNSETDCKLIFISRRSIMPAYYHGSHFTFSNIPPGLRVKVLALKYRNGKAYIHLKRSLTKKKYSLLDFKEVSIQELKEELIKLN